MTIHRIKRITFFLRTVPIILQNENGPCPLIAIGNVLLLRGHITLPSGCMEIKTEEIVSLLANRLFEGNSSTLQSKDPDIRAQAQNTIDHVIKILPNFAVGLDVNVRFNKVSAFEFTQQMSTFDLVDIQLYHGWIYHQEDTRTKEAVGNMSYNELITRIITLRSKLEDKKMEEKDEVSDDDDGPTLQDALELSKKVDSNVADVEVIVEKGEKGEKGEVERVDVEKEGKEEGKEEKEETDDLKEFQMLAAMEDFLNSTGTQLSYQGLVELHTTMRDRQLAVFFRNNHFNTLFKFESNLYLLLTDVGYEHQAEYVWEKLTEIDGDTMCVTSDFKRSPTASSLAGSKATAHHDESDPDYLLAMQLQHQQSGGGGGSKNGGNVVVGEIVGSTSGSIGGGNGNSGNGNSGSVTTHESGVTGVTAQRMREQEQELRRLKQLQLQKNKIEEKEKNRNKKKKCAIQ
jgi:hypothetical protein